MIFTLILVIMPEAGQPINSEKAAMQSCFTRVDILLPDSGCVLLPYHSKGPQREGL